MTRSVMLIAAVLASCAGLAVATPAAWASSSNTEVLVNEPFTGSSMSSSNWTVPSVPSGSQASNVACLTAGTSTSEKPVPGCSSTPLDASGNGALRLTPDTGNDEGGVAYGLSVPTTDGIDATFDTYQYGQAPGSAADGIGFFLAAADPTNPQPPASIGQPGGSLGYSAYQENSSTVDPGMSYGYLGIGLDVYGNYTNKAFEGTGCTADPSWEATVPNNVSVRGPGNGTTGYCMQNSTLSTSSKGLPAGSLDGGQAGNRSNSKVRVEIVINPSSSSVTSATYGVAVPAGDYMVAFQTIGSSTDQTLTGALPAAPADFPQGWVNPTTHIPYQLTFGWVGSTGGQKEVHEVNDVQSATASGIPAKLTTSMTDDAGGAPASGSTIDYHVAVGNKAGTSSDSGPITLNDTLPSGETPSSTGLGGNGWSCTISGQKVSCTNGGPLASGANLPDLVIPATVTAGAGTQLTNSLVASSNDSDPTSGQGSVTVATPPTDTSTCDPADGSGGWFVSAPTCTVQGTDPNPGIDHVAYKLDGATITTGSGTTSQSVPITTDGTHTLETEVFNSSGQGSGWSTRTLDVDTTPPDDTSSCGTPDGSSGWFVTDPTCTVKGSDPTSGVDHISYQLDDGTTVTTGSGTTTANLPITTDGTHTLRTRVYNTAGLSSGWRSETIDVLTARPSAPVVTSPASGSLTRDVSPTVTVSGQPGDSVTVQVDGVDYGPVTLGASGEGHVQVHGPLSDGQHTVRAEQTDAAGNVSPWSATSTWTVKTSTSAQLSGPTSGPTGVTTPVIDYAGEPGDQFTITVDGRTIATGVIPAGGTGSLTLPAPLADGPHTIEVTTTDAAGNTASRSIVVTIDTRAPEAPTAPAAPGTPRILTAPGDLTASTGATFTFGDGEPGVSYQCSLDGGAWRPCSPRTTFSSLRQGPHTLEVRAVDAAGNVSPSAQDAWTVKSTPPPAPTILGGPSRYTVASPTSFDISSEPGTTLQCSVDGGRFKPCARLVNLQRLRVGHHSLAVRQVDEAGNVSPRTTYRWTVLRRAGSGGLPRKAATLVARDSTAYGDRGFAVGCKLNAGSVRSCHVAALYHGRRVGQGTRTVARRGHTGTVVTVRLNARGRRLLRQALGGLPITLRSEVRPFGFARLPAGAKTVLYAPLRILVPDVLFAFDSSTLTPAAHRIVHTIAADVKGARRVVCEGNTDSYGSRSYNQRLGLRRATAVCTALRALGVHVTTGTVSYGYSRPVASNATPAGRHLNRRVVIAVSYDNVAPTRHHTATATAAHR